MAAAEPDGRVWLVTGASSGFGRAIADAALAAGDTVVGTARRAESLADWTAAAPDRAAAVALDLTDARRAPAAVQEVLDRFGRVDVLVNNAGHGQVGAVEETTDEELREIFEVHVFGPAALVRAVLPGMRARRSGAIVQLSSFGGQVAYPGFSAYCATKYALEGFSDALAAEVAPHGIRVLIVEPGSFRTGFAGRGLHRSTPNPAYDDTVGPVREGLVGSDGAQPGDPAKAAAAILWALETPDAPLRLPLGADAVDGIRTKLTGVLADLDRFAAVSTDVTFDGP
jgi:NAD(P)-dependent dehydrogenase (short-subunit alcohol dehydrogenase family)